jgi:hypothetical protein
VSLREVGYLIFLSLRPRIARRRSTYRVELEIAERRSISSVNNRTAVWGQLQRVTLSAGLRIDPDSLCPPFPPTPAT